MTPNSAYELVEIKKDTDYSPKINQDHNTSGPVSSKGASAPIFALWCVESVNTGTVKIQLLGNDNPITIPANAFKVGVVYYMYIKRILDDCEGKVKFIGYRYKESPIQF